MGTTLKAGGSAWVEAGNHIASLAGDFDWRCRFVQRLSGVLCSLNSKLSTRICGPSSVAEQDLESSNKASSSCVFVKPHGSSLLVNYAWLVILGHPWWLSHKESTCQTGDLGLIPELGRSPGEGKGYPLQYSDLENSIDCTVHGVTESRTRLSNFPFHFHKSIIITWVSSMKALS